MAMTVMFSGRVDTARAQETGELDYVLTMRTM